MLFRLSRPQFKPDPLLFNPGFKGQNMECWLMDSHKSLGPTYLRISCIRSSLSVFRTLV